MLLSIPSRSTLPPLLTGNTLAFIPNSSSARFISAWGPSIALDGEEDDSEKLLEFLHSRLYVPSF